MSAAPGKGLERVLTAELEANRAAERALEQQHERIVSASQDSNADDEHDPEGSTIAFERQQVAALLAQVRDTGAALRRALTDLAAGTYGSCATCGQAIDPERLRVRPQARTCIGCARREGRARR